MIYAELRGVKVNLSFCRTERQSTQLELEKFRLPRSSLPNFLRCSEGSDIVSGYVCGGGGGVFLMRGHPAFWSVGFLDRYSWNNTTGATRIILGAIAWPYIVHGYPSSQHSSWHLDEGGDRCAIFGEIYRISTLAPLSGCLASHQVCGERSRIVAELFKDLYSVMRSVL